MGQGALGPPRQRVTVLSRLLRAIDRVLQAFGCALLVALLAIVALGVAMRALDDPLIWSDELARFLMVWLAMLGWIMSSRSQAHVRIRYFQDLLPASARRAAETVIQAAMAVLGAIVAWYGVDLVRRNASLEATTMPVSMAWMYVPLVPAGIVTVLQALREIVRPRRGMSSPVGESAVE
jgi:TRAP-type C4-dicarboxylate transport system permease small subunit